MRVSELKEKLSLEVVTEGDMQTEMSGCYIGDLLSLAMSKVKPGNVWITIQTNLNVVAVAGLTEAACVIIPDGITVEEATLQKARVQQITILRTEKSAFWLACQLKDIV